MSIVLTGLLIGSIASIACAGQDSLLALIDANGRVSVSQGREQLCTITPGLFESQWKHAGLGGGASATAADPKVRSGLIRAPGGVTVDCELRPELLAEGVLLRYLLTPREAINLNSLHVSMDFAASVLVGGAYVADGETGSFPESLQEVHLRSADTSQCTLTLPSGVKLNLRYEAATPVLLQDNRQWGPSLCVRMGPQMDAAQAWPAGKALQIAFTLTGDPPVQVEFDDPVTIQAGEEWVPLDLELYIVPGSALDFSGFGQLDPPAGKHGWLIATPDGQFAFEDARDRPRRFYGVNFCFSAQYISHDQADRLADRLMRLGYNTVRFHHFESLLVDRSAGEGSTGLKPAELDQLDYLFAALKRRGLYATTDLFISRPVPKSVVWDGETGDLAMNDFKMLVPVNERAFDNWKQFAGNLMEHENPYTGLRYADDPALAWISMINEGNFGNYIRGVKDRVAQDWQSAWNRWLVEHYVDREGLSQAWNGDLQGDPADGTVALSSRSAVGTRQAHDFSLFLADTELRMFGRMRQFLREEIGTRALLTNMNGWSNPAQAQLARAGYDYVDDHFYVDHPQFLEQSWRLPSRCSNRSPVAGGAPGGRGNAFVRMLDKPFTISEYNYSGPGRFRGVGGIITGCMAALQDWSVLWRFAYSHSRGNLFEPSTAGYFDLASDPLNQAAERASLCLFLRGDMAPAPHRIAITMQPEELRDPAGYAGGIAPAWNALALVTGVGTYVGPAEGAPAADLVLPVRGAEAQDSKAPDPYGSDARDAIMGRVREAQWLAADNKTNLKVGKLHSETGQLLVDAPADTLVLSTPRTAGGYAPAGSTIDAGSVRISIDQTDATVWVSALDDRPIAESGRLLITHLTDLQNTQTQFGERARQTLLSWGKLPHLVRAGKATVRIRHQVKGALTAWSLATSGRRLNEVPVRREGDELVIGLCVAQDATASMMYEVLIAAQ